MGYGMMNNFGIWGGWGMVFGGVMMVFWIVVLVALVVFLVRWIGRTPNGTSRRDAAEILKQRYARGEIDVTEYEERLQVLRSAD
jgi:putative membrane protein